MRVLYCFISIPGEGSQVHVESFARAFRSLGEDIVLVSFSDMPYAGDKKAWSLFRRLRVRVSWFVNNLKYALIALGRARVNGVDVVLFRFDPLNRFAGAVCLVSLFYPVVLEVNALRSIEQYHNRPASSDFLDWLSLSRARSAFVVSTNLRDHVIGHYGVDGRKLQVIANGVDETMFSPEVSGQLVRDRYNLGGRFVIGFVGSFRPWHGVQALVEVAASIVPRLPSVALLLVGDGPDRQKCEALVRERGLTSHVIFVGSIRHAEVPQYIAAMDVVTAPFPEASYDKGFYGSALKLFEYMAMAKPVVMPGLGQIGEVIEDGVSGIICPAESIAGMTEAIINLYDSAAKRSAIGVAAREVVMRSYTWKANARKVQSLCVAASSE